MDTSTSMGQRGDCKIGKKPFWQGTTAGSKGVRSLMPFFKLQLRAGLSHHQGKAAGAGTEGEVQEEFAYELFL